MQSDAGVAHSDLGKVQKEVQMKTIKYKISSSAGKC